MVGEIIVKVKPDTKALDKELKKPRTFSGLLGFGKKEKEVEGGIIKELKEQLKSLNKSIEGATSISEIRGLQKEKKGVEKELGKATGKKSEKALGGILGKVGKMAGLLSIVVAGLDAIGVLKPLLELFKAIVALLFLPLVPIFVPALKILTKFIPILAMVMGKVRDFVQKMVDFFTSGAIVDFVKNFFSAVWDTIVKAWEVLKKGGQFLWDLIISGFKVLLTVGKFLFDLWVTGFKILYIKLPKFLFDSLIKGFKVLFKIGKNIWEKIKSGLNFIADLGAKIWGVLKNALSGIGSLLINGFKAIINGAIGLANAFLPGFAKIPELANGGIVTRPTLALIGERGPEAVVPLNRGGGFGGGATITNHFQLGPISNDMDIRVIAEKIAEINKDELAMSTGSQRF